VVVIASFLYKVHSPTFAAGMRCRGIERTPLFVAKK